MGKKHSDFRCSFIEAFKTAKETFNGLDIVVNSAGIFDGKNWENEIVTNLVRTPLNYVYRFA